MLAYELDTFIQYACFLVGMQIVLIGIISLMAYNRRFSEWGLLGRGLYHVVYWWYVPFRLLEHAGGASHRWLRAISDYDCGDKGALIGGLSVAFMGLFVIAAGMLYL